MNTNIKQASLKHATLRSSSMLAVLQDHPLLCDFLLAYGFAWLWEIPMFGIWHEWFPGHWLVLSPTLAAFVTAWITEGKAGMGRILRRCLAWRAGIQWYLVALLCVPILFIVGFTILIAWVFNRTRGNVLLAMLFHASINGTVENFPGTFFPSVFPPTYATHAGIPLWTEVGMLIVGIVIVVVTRGRLGYDQYQHETIS